MEYTIKLEFNGVESSTPLEAVKKVLEWIEEGANVMTYNVEDENSTEKFTVDLGEEDEDAVLPDND